jgi:type II secretory pathway pseudopilin PulG
MNPAHTGSDAAASTAGRHEAGAGLIELMITVTLIGLVLTAVFATLFRTSDESHRVNKLVEARQNARLAIQLIERDTRMAGSGWGRATVIESNNGTPVSLYGINPGCGGSGSDSLGLIGAWSTATGLRAKMPNASAIIKAASVMGFADNDLCVITNGSSAHLFQVTHVSDPPGDLQHNPTSPYNAPGGFSNWPAGGYGPGAAVYKIDNVMYRVDNVNFGRPALVRQVFGQPPQVLAWDVQRFIVRYRMQNGSWTRSPASIASIDRIRPTVVMRIDQTPRPAWTDSCWAEIRPRTF